MRQSVEQLGKIMLEQQVALVWRKEWNLGGVPQVYREFA
jgi:hypothetical protein